jgi:hypothetical protein
MLFTKTVLLALLSLGAVAFAAPVDTTVTDLADPCGGSNANERG